MQNIKPYLQSKLDKRFSNLVSIGAKMPLYLSDDTEITKRADLIANFDIGTQLRHDIDIHTKRNY